MENVKEGSGINKIYVVSKKSLTLNCPACQIRHIGPKFWFQFKKQSPKIFSYERRESRDYESVGDKSVL